MSDNYKSTIDRCGTVIKDNGKQVAVLVDGMLNMSSSYNAFWYKKEEVELLEEIEKMSGFEKVAIVKLIEDVNKKDYAFALFESEAELLGEECAGKLVVVNARNKNNRILGVVQEIKNVEDYNRNGSNGSLITAEVVGVVNTSGFEFRKAEEDRKKRIKKERADIECEVRKRINKLNSIAMFEKVAKEYKDVDPELIELVEKLKTLSE